MQTIVDGVDAFHEFVGKDLGHSEWQTITQERVNLFADATDDHQWIHVDPERAKSGPFGVAIAHGISRCRWHRCCSTRSSASTTRSSA